MCVDLLAHRVQQVLHVLHAVLQRDEPTHSLRHTALSQEQRVMRGQDREARALACDREMTAALTAISLHALSTTSCALTTSLTASSRCCAHYTLCYSETSPLAASDMQH